MLEHPSEVVRTLVRYRDIFDPRTGSIIVLTGATAAPGRDPFRGGFIAGIEERAELLRRLGHLDHRKRLLLFLWYVTSLPVTQIARRIHVSRMHCYRLRNQALEEMTQAIEDRERTPAPAPHP